METRAESGAWGKKRRDELQGADLGLERAKIHDAWDASEVEARGDERAWEGSEDLEAQWRPTPRTTDRFESLSFAAAASIFRAPPLAARPQGRTHGRPPAHKAELFSCLITFSYFLVDPSHNSARCLSPRSPSFQSCGKKQVAGWVDIRSYRAWKHGKMGKRGNCSADQQITQKQVDYDSTGASHANTAELPGHRSGPSQSHTRIS
ncbi:hypothetical protein AXG93_1998s1120 [Marchantia polymorpha subsp. ruderalis]|uniref:Uncharacterized protein n=1 Tax=Marchantia polymorpha subsp. ruderalis TaxID=1480154 RepID=A0A176VLR9_MARPO|nr:hypothetical protein AXG93_1998s1120 [Marchantia polymorpha subsp. ruderalis]